MAVDQHRLPFVSGGALSLDLVLQFQHALHGASAAAALLSSQDAVQEDKRQVTWLLCEMLFAVYLVSWHRVPRSLLTAAPLARL